MRIVSALKATLAVAAGFIITFSQVHSAQIGLMVLGGYGVSLGLVLLASFFFAKSQFLQNLPEAILLLVFGIFAHLVLASEVQLAGLKWLLASLGLSLTAVHLYIANSLGLKTKKAADSVITALLNAGLGLLFVVFDLDEVAAVGFFGAYLVLLAVHLGISAASPNATASAK